MGISWGLGREILGKFKERCQGRLDYALFRLTEQAPIAHTCFTHSVAEIPLGTPVALAGYPGNTNRKMLNPRARDASGDWQHISLGMTGDWPACRMAHSQTELALHKDLKSDGYLQVSADAAPGGSGGMMFLKTGEGVGVLSFLQAIDPVSSECVGGTFVTSMSKILPEIRRSLPAEDIDEAFRCDKKSFLKAL